MKQLFILNSDFGIGNTIGARAYHVLKENKSESIIFCRDYNKKLKNKYNLIKVIPKGELFMKGLTFCQVYISSKLPYGNIRNFFFEYFLIKKLKKYDLKEIEIIHSWDFLPKVYSYIKRKNPNIKIIQDVPIGFPTILKNLKDKSYFSPEQLKIEIFVQRSFKYCDYYVVPSDFVKDSLILANIPKNKILKVPFGVDKKKYRVANKKKKDDKFRVAFSGNINLRKGVPYIVKAWKELKLKNAELNIYGRIYTEVKKYFYDANKYNIKLHGFVDLTKKLPQNDIFLFPSLMEGSAKSIYEAMACGLPSIVTYNSGSIVRDGKDGFIVGVQDVESIKEKILYFYNNRSYIDKMGASARSYVENYSWETYARNINKIYSNLLR